MPSSTHHYRKSLGADITKNYERYFVPTIGKAGALKEWMGITLLTDSGL